jgi:acyl-[acyl-carrier-protein]-phospholipid O-acyltransferase/long-chain-fatty-acid--[acyl-carrier-protein] ligase
MNQQLSESLTNRTFIGLLLAQFTATFNDQAIHMVAVFYSADMLVRFAQLKSIDEKAVVAIVTACFITPFLLFSSYAGPLGDRFSKRSVIVFWKVAEVGMMSLALLGLALPHFASPETMPHIAVWSSALVISTVFLMGMHSTFFVPAKLGAMPEILHPAILSRGNGVLEGTSFTAQILGTSMGGILYSLLKGEITPVGLVDGREVMEFRPNQEWMIGVLLLGLALLGTATAFLMDPIPAAAPDRKLSWNWWAPLQANLSILWRSKPLTLSVTGIAFCVFITLFLRQTLLYQGELSKELRTARVAEANMKGKPAEKASKTRLDQLIADVLPDQLEKAAQESELRVALLFAVVGLGVGLGSILAGYLSGHRVELGLVPLGAVVIILFTFIPSVLRGRPGLFVAALFGIGCGAGFYLVPLYTLLQHRAPKESKGNVVAASNFLNVVGGIVSVAVFYLMAFLLGRIFGTKLTESDVVLDPALIPTFVAEAVRQMNIPRYLFLSTTVLTAAAIFLLRRMLPDFFLRTAIWIHAWGHNTLRTIGIESMPTSGPVVLLTNCDVFHAALDLIAGVDRYPHVMLVERPELERSWLRPFARRAGLISIPANPAAREWDEALQTGRQALVKGEMAALTVNQTACASQTARLIEAWRAACPNAVAIPVFCTSASHTGPKGPAPLPYPRVIFGEPLPSQTTLEEALAAIERLASTTADA